MLEYQERVSREVESYREERPELRHPSIFTYWAGKHLSPRLRDTMGTDSIADFFAASISAGLRRSAGADIASIGCGDCGTEIEIAKIMLAGGNDAFTFHCYDISPYVTERARAAIAADGLGKHFDLVVQDLNAWAPEMGFASVMANHSLHHMVGLEHIFEVVHERLTADGTFVVADMIGRNGHMRWPEALEIIDAVWRFCPDAYKYNHLLHRFEESYDNWDCANDGFEGVRAQDILPALVGRFSFERFLGFGNLPDIFIERTFGPNLDAGNPRDTAFIDFLEMLNTRLTSAGVVKPTQMFAIMGKNSARGVFDRGWSPEFCIRPPDTSGET